MTPEGYARLRLDEGLELDAYPDPLSPLGLAVTKAGFKLRGWRLLPNGDRLSGHPWTVGYGHTGVDVGPNTRFTQTEALAAQHVDVARFEAELDRRLPWWRTLDPVREDVVSNMAFNLGVDGLLCFKRALAAIKAGQWAEAEHEMLDSDWSDQVKGRAVRLAREMRTGKRT